jgi:dynamin GTPase
MDTNLIRLINDLQDCLTAVDPRLALRLPQIAVVGNQSSGKSSVLEHIVGKDFLPRGTGIVTRRPLILQLIRDATVREDYAQFLHLPSKRFTDFEQIRREIDRETDRLTGANKGISPTPIHMKIVSADCIDLTLIDLPGEHSCAILCLLWIRHDQGARRRSAERHRRTDPAHAHAIHCRRHVSNTRCVRGECRLDNSYLVYTPNPRVADLSTSDALQLAQRVDVDGARTVCVLTKLDLMDAGTHARMILDNELIPLTHGYAAVVNRSQRDVDAGVPIAQALMKEEAFFK